MHSPTVQPERRSSVPASKRSLATSKTAAASATSVSSGLERSDESGARAVAAAASATSTPAQSRVAAALEDFSPLDWFVVFFFGFLVVAVVAGTGRDRGASLAILAVDWVVLLLGLGLTRGKVLARGTFASALVYRFTIFGTILASYFELRMILPAASARAVDGHLYAFDLAVFGVEPSLAWDRFVTPGTVEWFAFFYFGYFFILGIHVLPFMFLGKNLRVLARFALGVSLVFCVGHMTYILVPGYGPYAFLASSYHHEITGGTFWHLVQEAVASAGAQKDIFPSLHTAVPTFFAIFAYRHRKDQWPFRYTWPIAAFCALQIIGATMFLRWHYLVDILAGLTLAFTANIVAEKLTTWDEERRAARGLGPAWTGLKLPWSWQGSTAQAQTSSSR